MKINNINITETIAKARQLLKDKTKVSAEFAVLFSIILDLFEVLLGRLSKNSKNSSIPPSQDPNREKTPKSDGTKRKPGGQKGRKGTQIKPVENPDEIVSVSVDRKTLPSGHIYKTVGVAKRQVVEFLVKSKVIEYQLEIVADENGKRFTAEGPLGTSRPIQYGASLKATASYMSIYQLIPYGRVEGYFRDQAGIPISSGTLLILTKKPLTIWKNFNALRKKNFEALLFFTPMRQVSM